MTNDATKSPPLPPRWFIRLAWRIHRGIHRITGGRKGLRPPRGKKYGLMRLTTIGRRSGQERSVILAYLMDEDRYVTLAMNGWDPADPAWWLNLQANPQAHLETVDGSFPVVGSAAQGEDRDHLWARWVELDGEKLDGYATRRPGGTAVVVLEPIN